MGGNSRPRCGGSYDLKTPVFGTARGGTRGGGGKDRQRPAETLAYAGTKVDKGGTCALVFLFQTTSPFCVASLGEVLTPHTPATPAGDTTQPTNLARTRTHTHTHTHTHTYARAHTPLPPLSATPSGCGPMKKDVQRTLIHHTATHPLAQTRKPQCLFNRK
jgi:hypothetical protein